MKNTLSALIFFVGSIAVFAQPPNAFNYQAVVRDNTGSIIPNQTVSFRFSVHDDDPTGIIEYSEKHVLSTNDYGSVNLNIGNGTPVSGTFSAIDWGDGPKYLEIELDPVGGTSYVSMGTSQLLSVPYALYAEEGEPGPEISDDDNNTRITVEETPNDDTIRFYVADNEVMQHNGKTLEMLNNGKSVFIGEKAGRYDDGTDNYNVYGGYQSGSSNTSGNANTFMGAMSGKSSFGSKNSFFGTYSGKNHQTGEYNSYFGYNCGSSTGTGGYNSFFGAEAGVGAGPYNIGEGNSFFGYGVVVPIPTSAFKARISLSNSP